MMGEAFKCNVQDTGMRKHLLMMGKGKSFEELRELAREWESVNRGDVDNAVCYRIQSSRLVGNNVNNSKTELLERRLIDCERRLSEIIGQGNSWGRNRDMRSTIKCYRCQGIGHMARECRVPLNH